MPGRFLKEYDGPLYKKEIVGLIRKEAEDEGILLPDDVITDIIGYFFKSLVSSMDKKIIHIDRLGDFGPTKENAKRFQKKHYDMMLRRRHVNRKRILLYNTNNYEEIKKKIKERKLRKG